MLTGARPVYMVPTRNRYGIIGPISPDADGARGARATGGVEPADDRRSPDRSRCTRWSPTAPTTVSATTP